MAQSYATIPQTQTIKDSRQPLLDRDDAAASNFSGTAFPTTNLLVGMKCHRTDLNKIYILKDTTPTWVEETDISGASGKSPLATQLATGRNFSISGDGTAPSVAFNGSSNVALNLTLAATGVTAGTYTKVTVDAKGRVTGGAAISNTDLPADIARTTIRASSTAALTLASTDHALGVGNQSGVNLALDGNDIQARNAGAASALRLNLLGGNVTIGDGATSVVTLDGTLNSASAMIATVAEVQTPTSNSKIMTPARTADQIAAAISVTGSAPVFSCRAYLRCNPTTSAIYASGNIADIQRAGVGDYTISFFAALPANYAWSVFVGNGATCAVYELNATSFRIRTIAGYGGAFIDVNHLSVVFFG